MKTLKKTTLAVALMLGTLSSYALSNVETAPKAISNSLTNNEVKKGHLVIIKDNNGSNVYSEIMQNDGDFTSQFDFSELQDGLYTLEINKDFEITTSKFVVNSKQVMFLDNSETTVYKPVFRMEDTKVLISQLALDKESTLEICIFFEGEVIHSEKVSGNAILNRVYNLKENIPGKYKVVMRANGRTYRKTFRI